MNKKRLMKFLRTSKAMSEEDNVVYAHKYVHNEIGLSFKDNNIIVEVFDEEEETVDDVLASSL